MSLFMESAIKRSQLIKDWKVWVNRIALVIEEIIPGAEIYVVGSVARGDSVGGSDVDILVISDRIPDKPVERSRIKAIIEEKLDLPYYHPFEIHLLKPSEAEYYIERSKGFIIRVNL